ncbi:MAG: metallophosphoesterase, partial [Actinomycetes bacterium]
MSLALSPRSAGAAVAIGAVALAGLVPAGAAAATVERPLLITEIVADNVGYDDFEFFEVTNTTDAAIDLAAQGLTFEYFGASTPTPLTTEEPVVIAAGATTVFWVSYTATNVDSFAHDEAAFRAHFPATEGEAYDLVRVTGQAGFANGGNRGVRLVDGADAVVASSFYGAGDVGTDLAVTFGVPAGDAVPLEVRGRLVAPTPGTVDAALLEPLPTTDAVGEEWPLVVTEIQANNSGTDNYEYVEIANLTAEDQVIGEGAFSLAYTYANSTDRTQDVPLAVESPVTVPAGGVAVLWLVYDARLTMTVADFRAFYSLGEDVVVGRLTGQPGLANTGDRGIRIVDANDEIVGWSHYGAADVGNHLVAEFSVPRTRATLAMPVYRSQAAPSPGTVDAAALRSPLDRPTDPALETSMLQITELLPDSDNVGGSDAYEFIEIYNATDAPQAWEDFTLRYLYPLADLTTSSSALWPTAPRDVTIAPGGTLVVWVKNGANDALTAADFNAAFGTALEAGVDLVEVSAGGMANGSIRGMEIITNTGVSINRAYYNVDGADDTAVNQGIQYAVDGEGDTVQALTGIAAASPGRVDDAQIHPALAVAPAGGEAPAIVDLTATTFTPGEPFTVEATVTDDVLVRTVTLTLNSDVDTAPQVLNLTPGEDGVFRTRIAAVDTAGKGEYTYELTASDGHAVTAGGTRTVVSSVAADTLRMGLEDGQFVSGLTPVSAAADHYPATLTLAVDGADVAGQPELERAPVFAFEATQTDMYFKNGVVMDGDVLTIFDQGFYGSTETVSTPLPLDRVNPGEPFAVRIYAGTKKAPEIDLNENNDNFAVTNLRLILPDGRTLRPAEIADPTAMISMGDSGGALDYVEATFTAPDDAFTALSYDWDTTTVADGPHTVSARDGDATASAEVHVDNTAPTVVPTVADGAVVHGDFAVDATVTDAGAGVESLSATLDGRRITLPYAMSSFDDAPGDHTAVFVATDVAGNTRTVEVDFTIPEEDPSVASALPADGAAAAGSVELSATVEDPTGDALDVEFAAGTPVALGSGLEVSAGDATTALSTDRVEARAVSAAEVEALAALDGADMTVASDAKLPYLLLEAAVPAGAPAGSEMRVRWDGSANPKAKVLLYVLDPEAGAWVELDRHLTGDEGEASEDFTLEGIVPVDAYAVDGTITALVQHSEGYAGDDLSTRDSAVEPHHPDDTPRAEYDFTVAWESDTQYYNANESIYDRQVSIHDYLLAEREDLNLQYLVHTGDIVNTSTIEDEWVRADATYAELDAAGLPYGVLAGNHDVDQRSNDYTAYSRWFGEARFQDNPWYTASYLDNRGHYDLITAGGIDFIFLYMGWAPGDAEIDWMNEVLARYPERIAFVNLHEYMLTTGGLGEIPQRIYDEVVAPNANVRFVTSGHYHDAYTRLDSFDDDGDGIDDRTVTQMLFDYQGLPNGGEGYLRLLHFDTEGETITVRTYSDYLADYDSDDPTLDPEHQDFVIPFAQAGIEVATKALVTDAVRADLLSDQTIASFEDVPSGSTVTATWTPGPGEHSWYVRAADPHGAVAVSDVRTVTVAAPSFVDVEGSEHAAAIGWLAAEGISTGWSTPSGQEFRPLAQIKRDAMAAFLYRYAG